MRLGSLFSKVLDPEKPPLFGGASDGIPNGDGTRTPFDLGLLPQERWEAGSAGVLLQLLCLGAHPSVHIHKVFKTSLGGGHSR